MDLSAGHIFEASKVKQACDYKRKHLSKELSRLQLKQKATDDKLDKYQFHAERQFSDFESRVKSVKEANQKEFDIKREKENQKKDEEHDDIIKAMQASMEYYNAPWYKRLFMSKSDAAKAEERFSTRAISFDVNPLFRSFGRDCFLSYSEIKKEADSTVLPNGYSIKSNELSLSTINMPWESDLSRASDDKEIIKTADFITESSGLFSYRDYHSSFSLLREAKYKNKIDKIKRDIKSINSLMKELCYGQSHIELTKSQVHFLFGKQ